MQALMDDLDLPPDRANLFEAFPEREREREKGRERKNDRGQDAEKKGKNEKK